MSGKAKWAAGLILAIAVGLLGVVLLTLSRARDRARTGVTQSAMSNLAESLLAYKGQLGRFPTGDVIAVTSALTGDRQQNASGTVFWAVQPSPLQNRKPVDAWKRPLRIQFHANDGVTISSAGPNGRWEANGGDDIAVSR